MLTAFDRAKPEPGLRVTSLASPAYAPNKPAEGRKDDAGKLPWGLLPYDAIACVVKVLQFGAGKYAPRNWELGMDWSRPFEACIRHLTAWWQRDEKDPETGMSHLWHAGCCIVFLIAYELRGTGKDDRPSAGQTTGALTRD